MSPRANVDQLLVAWSQGDDGAFTTLLPLVYDELRQLARRHLRGERDGHTLQPTALVHEAYARLVDQERVEWRGRTHFFAVAAETMRRILVDHARKRRAAKRGGQPIQITLDPSLAVADRRDVDVIALDDALNALAILDGTQAKLVELRYFSGLGIEETAQVLGISSATVKREWHTAKAWLYRQMTKS
ncbi:MAG: sigma-70 family RNA polymerase sigma factor [Myxococcales bacterium]